MNHTFENNGLIADFMEMEFSNGEYYLPIHNSGDWIPQERLQFNTSWDWLMPVVEKINLTTDEWGNTNDLTIGNGYVWVDPHIGDRIFFSGNNPEDKEEPMISKVYRGVLAFINSDC